ncbi:hypothetical protein DL98DRAFT_662597 [Cadophora sp. DSE1049]|nr:hypothetical protein DL98DRAFT_662597 [Cadophora sp. DSE1049]
MESTANMNEDMEDADSVLSYYGRQDRGQSQESSGVSQAGGQSQPSSVQEERRQEQRRQEQRRQEQRRQEQLRQEQLRLEEDLQRSLEEERLERERRAQDQHEQEKVEIQFKVWERHYWKALPSIHAHPEDSSEVERIVKKYMRKKFRALNTNLQMLAPQDCFQAVIDDRTHTILLVSQDSLRTDEMEESAKRLHDYALRTENISRLHRGKKRR